MQNLLVKVDQGYLRGVSERNVNGMSFIAFRGVPYAKPPIGHLRFKDPEPIVSWSGVKDTTKFGNPCAQRNWVTLQIIGSDDCLYLNIYTPTLRPTTPKAVMVWIHGGSFISESGDDFFYGPDYLIENDIVLVTINYRVGILGFLNIEDEEAPGNQGLKDQVQALKWIQQNIAQFGGDPNNVTIFGHSAGGASVHYLTVSPLGQGLFHKAIIQSGIASHPWASMRKPYTEPVEILGSLLEEDISTMIEFVDFLRTLDAHDLVRVEIKILTHLDHIMNSYPFLPSIDSKAKNPFLTIPIEEAVKIGIRVPCIFGFLSHEGLSYVAAVKNKLYDQRNPNNLLLHPCLSRFLEQYNVTSADVKQFFFGEEKISSFGPEKFRDVISALYFDIGFHNIIAIQSQIMDIPMYVYKFEYELEVSVIKNILGVNMKGTCHGDEIGLLFFSKLGRPKSTKSPPHNAMEHRLIRRFTEMWTNFAKTGNPTPRITDSVPIIWEPIDNSSEFKCLKINDELAMDTVKNINQQLIDSKKK